MREPFYRMTYHRVGWMLADAFRPKPGWGSRSFTAPVAALGDLTEDAVLAAAHEAAPQDHRLTSLELYPADGPERVIWSTPPDARFEAKAAIGPEGIRHA